jgi:hypothetical protein
VYKSSGRRWKRMIIDGRGGAEVRYQECHEDRRLGREVCAEANEKGYYVLVVLFVVDEFRRVHVQKDVLHVHEKLCCRRR